MTDGTPGLDSEIGAGLARVRARIADSGRDPAGVRLVGVTKGFAAATAAAAFRSGVTDLGENYAQELVVKAAEVPEATWHFLGPVQRNKIAALAPLVSWWHGVDRLVVGQAIAARAPRASVLVQVNLSGAAGRPGVSWVGAAELVGDLRDAGVDVAGLMGVATAGSPDLAAEQFHRLAGLAATLGLVELSMGMSDDLEAALEAGATIVRVGRALLGARPQSPMRTE